ncbi:hypothetical protein IAR50_005653 [Cryptococcus sp. DSM 104548]
MSSEQEEDHYTGHAPPLAEVMLSNRAPTARPSTMSSSALPANFSNYSRDQLLGHLSRSRPPFADSGYLVNGPDDETRDFFDREHPLYPRLNPVQDPPGPRELQSEQTHYADSDPSIQPYYVAQESAPGTSMRPIALETDEQTGPGSRGLRPAPSGQTLEVKEIEQVHETEGGSSRSGRRATSPTVLHRRLLRVSRVDLIQHCVTLTRDNESLRSELDTIGARFQAISNEDLELLRQSDAKVEELTEEVTRLRRERDAAVSYSRRQYQQQQQDSSEEGV